MRTSDRSSQWIETSPGFILDSGNVAAHSNQLSSRLKPRIITREQREDIERQLLAEGATLSIGAGQRDRPEEPDPMRTAFERDRDRILHSTAFRRLAGKTQVFIFPNDHQRTRLTHALEVSQVATAISRGIGLNIALTEAIALGHDCGHGPGGHASEDAFSKFLSDGYDHATWGADHTLVDLNLCMETLDGIRNHSWSRPHPATPEGAVVSFADRIAYCAHDLEDAIKAEVVHTSQIPVSITSVVGTTRTHQLGYFISDMVDTAVRNGEIALSNTAASTLGQLRRFNYDKIYMRPESIRQSEAVIRVLSMMVEYYISNPKEISIPRDGALDNEPQDPVVNAIGYVSGMTDRFAFQKAVDLIGYDPNKLPRGIDLTHK
ncbi:MAG: HD domain-containing protein [Acidimicrobiaceae bacterium]|nr:HD domain-containing protein [Acidimicrobiaceae bacterium]